MMEVGDRVESRATFEHFAKQGTVIALRKPRYVPWGTLVIPMQPVVLFDDGTVKTMRAHWVIKVK